MKYGKLQLIIYCIIFLIAFWISYIIIYGNGGIVKRNKMTRELRVLEAEIEQLKKEKETLSWEIKNLKSNKSYIGSVARDLGYKQEGEIIFKFVEKENLE
jgi:cell division protein FtsB